MREKKGNFFRFFASFSDTKHSNLEWRRYGAVKKTRMMDETLLAAACENEPLQIQRPNRLQNRMLSHKGTEEIHYRRSPWRGDSLPTTWLKTCWWRNEKHECICTRLLRIMRCWCMYIAATNLHRHSLNGTLEHLPSPFFLIKNFVKKTILK